MMVDGNRKPLGTDIKRLELTPVNHLSSALM